MLTRCLCLVVLVALHLPSPSRAAPLPWNPRQSQTALDRFGDLLPSGVAMRLGSTRWQQSFINPPDANSLSVSPDGRLVATCHSGRMMVRRITDGGHVRWHSHDWHVSACVFSADGKALITEGPNAKQRNLRLYGKNEPRCFRFFEVGTGKLERKVEYKRLVDPYDTAKFSSDGSAFLTLLDAHTRSKVVVLDPTTAKTVADHELELHDFSGWDISTKAKRLALPTYKSLVVFDYAKNRVLHTFAQANRRDWYTAPKFSPDDRYVVATQPDAFTVWDLATGKRLRRIRFERARFTFSIDGKRLACSNRKGIRLFDFPSLKEIRVFDTPRDPIHDMRVSPDERTIVTIHPTRVGVWDVRTGKCITTTPSHAGGLKAVEFSPDGRLLASGAWDGTAKLWNWKTGELLHELPGHYYAAISFAFSADGSILATGDGTSDDAGFQNESTIRLWDTKTGKKIREFRAHLGGVDFLRFSPDAKRLYSVGLDRRLRVWEASTGQRLRQLRNLSVPVFDLTPDGKRMLLATDGRLGVWDTATFDRLVQLDFPTQDFYRDFARFDPDGKSILVQDRKCQVAVGRARRREGFLLSRFDSRSGKQLESWIVPITATRGNKPLMFTIGSDVVGFARDCQGFQLCKWDSDVPFATAGGDTRFNTVAVSPDGQWLVTGDSRANVLVWDVGALRAKHLWKNVLHEGNSPRSIQRLRPHSKAALRWLRSHLEHLAQKELDIRRDAEKLWLADEVARQEATTRLRKLDRIYDGILEAVLSDSTSPEAIRRGKLILAARGASSESVLAQPSTIRLALQMSGQLDSFETVRRLADGPPFSAITKLARRILDNRPKEDR